MVLTPVMAQSMSPVSTSLLHTFRFLGNLLTNDSGREVFLGKAVSRLTATGASMLRSGGLLMPDTSPTRS